LCEKSVKEDEAYELKLKRNETKLTKSADVCHNCIKEKGILEHLAEAKWRKWNQKTFSWEVPE